MQEMIYEDFRVKLMHVCINNFITNDISGGTVFMQMAGLSQSNFH